MTVKGWEKFFESHSKGGRFDVISVEKMLLDVGVKATNSEAEFTWNTIAKNG